MRKLFSKIHLWLSVPFGIIIAITCISGAALIFEAEVNQLIHRERYFVKEVVGEPIPLNDLMRTVSRTLPDSVSITSVAISPNPERTYQVNLSQPRRAAVFVNQYTGEVVAKNDRVPFFLFMFKLHRWLLDSMKPDGGIFWGKMVVGVSTLMFVFVLITGLVIWVPRSMKGLKNRLKIETGKGKHRFWYDLHVSGGFYALLLLLVMSLTGLTWSFKWYNAAFYKVFGVEQPAMPAPPAQQRTAPAAEHERGGQNHSARKGEGKKQRDGMKRGNFRQWQTVLDEVSQRNADFKLITISNGSANVAFDKWGNQRASDKYMFNNQTGEITTVDLYKDQPNSGKMRGWIYSVHVGTWGGITTRILYFVAALLGGVLPITGYYLWIRRLIKKKKRQVNK